MPLTVSRHGSLLIVAVRPHPARRPTRIHQTPSELNYALPPEHPNTSADEPSPHSRHRAGGCLCSVQGALSGKRRPGVPRQMGRGMRYLMETKPDERRAGHYESFVIVFLPVAACRCHIGHPCSILPGDFFLARTIPQRCNPTRSSGSVPRISQFLPPEKWRSGWPLVCESSTSMEGRTACALAGHLPNPEPAIDPAGIRPAPLHSTTPRGRRSRFSPGLVLREAAPQVTSFSGRNLNLPLFPAHREARERVAPIV